MKELEGIDFSKKEILLVGTSSDLDNIEEYVGYQRIIEFWPSANVRVFEGSGFSDFVDALR